MREFQVWLDRDELDMRFQYIKELENNCRFSNCTHEKEPGCAIKKALEDGTLDKNSMRII
jgi:ribosome biogenesis GTPase